MFRSFALKMARPEQRGYWCGTYNIEDGPRECPGCGRRHWLVGRLSSECAFCGTTVPLSSAASGSTVIVHKNMTKKAERNREEQLAA